MTLSPPDWKSFPVSGAKNTVCRYRTTRDVTLNPMAVSDVVMTTEPDGRSALRLRFTCSGQTDWSQVSLKRLPLFLGEDAVTGTALHLWLTKRQAGLYLRLPGKRTASASTAGFRRVALAKRIVSGRRGQRIQRLSVIAGIFHLPRKIYVRASQWSGQHHAPAGDSTFRYRGSVQPVWQSDLPVTRDILRLHCVPVINLFTLEADPLTISGLENEYLLRPKRLQDGHTEIYSVDSVTGSGRTGNASYVPFTSFRHQGGMMRRYAPERYYHTRVKRGVSGMHDTG